MITKLTLRNFKSIEEQVYEFTAFDLLVGSNNSGKSTILQALAIWQYCVDEFGRYDKRAGSKGIQVVLPDFTALPLPEFNLLWRNRTDRHWPTDEHGAKKQKYILINIEVEWRKRDGELASFGIDLRYQSSQTIYAIPQGGFGKFRECVDEMPKIAYVPPFSGLETAEKALDISPIHQQVGKGQPGSVLRNLLLMVCKPPLDNAGGIMKDFKPTEDWNELVDVITRWFSVTIHPPKYDPQRNVTITVEYNQAGKDYDIIAGGSGFHQTLTLLAFLYGYKPTTILLDEPDAHLYVNLQRQVIDFFKRKSQEKNIQFLIATHAEEFVNGVDPSQVVSLLSQSPKRITYRRSILRAMADVSNEELATLVANPHILYVEGESDARILRAWANQCGAADILGNVCIKQMHGGTKKDMNEGANAHFKALREIVPGVSRLVLFDHDDDATAFRPGADNPSLFEWNRRNIENYLLVPDAWIRTVLKEMGFPDINLITDPVVRLINEFFIEQGLTLPAGRSWKNVSANVFQVVDGKRILFENDESLFNNIVDANHGVLPTREKIAANMTPDEIHADVLGFFDKLTRITQEA